jgi:hypothetical protein
VRKFFGRKKTEGAEREWDDNIKMNFNKNYVFY